tara:strand:+ start:1650 stop:1865 length:216 start_codon:yes stop_codon:yes gene_type:complete
MILTNYPQPEPSRDFCYFLQQEIGISKEALELGKRQSKLENAPLPIILRSFGLVTLEQYQRILSWERDYEQ